MAWMPVFNDSFFVFYGMNAIIYNSFFVFYGMNASI